jgi:hypothetical protein
MSGQGTMFAEQSFGNLGSVYVWASASANKIGVATTELVPS